MGGKVFDEEADWAMKETLPTRGLGARWGRALHKTERKEGSMNSMQLSLGEEEDPAGQRGQRGGTDPSERRRGWLIFWLSLGLLLLTVVGWVVMHTVTGKWVGPDSDTGFGKAPWQWVDWIVVALAGSFLYVVVSIAHWLIQPQARFKAFSAWYLATVIKGPILALVILLFLTGVKVEVSGLALDFTKLGPAILLVIAFLLGFYGTVAREQLNQVAKAVFPKAYGVAEEQFSIVPGKARVGPGMSVALKTSPYTEVTWKVVGGGSIVDGLYTAPQADQGQAGQEIQVVAVPKDPNIAAAVTTVTLTTMAIDGPVKVAYKAVVQYQAAPEPSGGIDWSFVPQIPGAAISKAGIFTAPTQAEAVQAGAQGVTIVATGKTQPTIGGTLDVRFS
jgi:hypothetical protein